MMRSQHRAVQNNQTNNSQPSFYWPNCCSLFMSWSFQASWRLRRDLLKLIPSIFPLCIMKHPPLFLTAPFQILISSQQDAVLTIVKSIFCRIVTKFIKYAHKHRWCLAFCPLWLEMKLTILSSEKNSQKLVTIALHLCTCSFLPAKFTRRPPILFPVSTQGAPSELYVVVSDKWIKGLWQTGLQVAASQAWQN